MMAVRVGHGGTVWPIHKALLMYSSPVLRQKLQGSESELHLQDFDSKAFTVFVDWMYSAGRGSLRVLPSDFDGIFPLLHLAINLEVRTLEKQITSAIKGYFRVNNMWPTVATMNQICSIAKPNSSISQFCAQCICYRLLIKDEEAQAVFDGDERPHVELVHMFSAQMRRQAMERSVLEDPREC